MDRSLREQERAQVNLQGEAEAIYNRGHSLRYQRGHLVSDLRLQERATQSRCWPLRQTAQHGELRQRLPDR